MDAYSLIAIVISLTALLAFLNERYIKLPSTIGITLLALLISLGILLISALGLPLKQYASLLLESVDFNETLMHGMLSYLLFAGALHVKFSELWAQRIVVFTLATLGVLLSTLLVGFSSYGLFQLLGIGLPLVVCLVFGALISPTDPIAVLSILKRAQAPKSLETKISGESLFNDGIGVVVFLVLSEIAFEHANPDAAELMVLLLKEAGGGLLFGIALGAVGYALLRQIDQYTVEVLITIALVTGGYALALHLELSGPLAVVMAGLIIGNAGRHKAMSPQTRSNVDTFWELLDETLNAILFMLIGLELIVISLNLDYVMAALITIPLVLASRFLSIALPIKLLPLKQHFSNSTLKILTWGGLRGGISIALVLSLPPGAIRDQLLTVTFLIVVFSVLVQGLTVGKVIQSNLE